MVVPYPSRKEAITRPPDCSRIIRVTVRPSPRERWLSSRLKKGSKTRSVYSAGRLGPLSVKVMTASLPLFRSDEMLLARAEANTMLGKFDEALDDLNCFIELRIPADDFDIATTSLTQAKILSYYSAQLNGANTFINSDFNKGRFLDGEQGRLQKALILTILDFRRIEFLYEGQRYYDILRWNIPVTHRDNSGQTSTLTPDDDRRILQIPQTAILAGVEANPMNNIPQPW